MSSELTVIRKPWDGNLDDTVAIMGGDDSNPLWNEYKDGFKEEVHPHLEALKKEIEKNWYQSTGQQHNGYCFEFSDGKKIAFTMRAWGDLMQAIVGEREGYMHYYM